MSKDSPRIGLWVECCSRAAPLSSKVALKEMLVRAKALGVTDLFVQVFKSGEAWYPSRQVRMAAPIAQSPCGFDPLDIIVSDGVAREIRVHAWLNAFNWGMSNASDVQAHLGSESLLVDSSGELCGKGPGYELDTPGLWLDPSSGSVRNFIDGLVQELVDLYPGLAGVHLDYLRYPYYMPMRPATFVRAGLDVGYGPMSISSFEMQVGIEKAFELDAFKHWQPRNQEVAGQFDEWRREQVGSYLSVIGSRLHRGQQLSVAVLPWADRAYLNAFQDWRLWLMEGSLNFVCLMSYTADRKHLEQMIRQAACFRTERAKVLGGIGLYKLEKADEIGLQEKVVLGGGADGFIYFSYGCLDRF